jgi:hypothetical protein
MRVPQVQAPLLIVIRSVVAYARGDLRRLTLENSVAIGALISRWGPSGRVQTGLASTGGVTRTKN